MPSQHFLFPLFMRAGRYLSLICVVSVCLGVYLGHGRPRQIIAFVKKVDYSYKPHVMDVELGVIQKVSDIPVFGCCPIWSPDGTRIAFNGTDRQPYVVDIYDGGARPLIGTDETGWIAAWSPDSTSLILTITTNLRGFYRVDADGTNLRRLSDDGLDSIMPVWSPDGRSIIFASGSGYTAKDIYRMDSDGGHVQPLTNQHSSESYPAIAPDGKRIAFVSSRDGNPDLYVMNVDGSDIQRLTRTTGLEMSPQWSPDGQHILYMAWTSRMFVSSGDINVIDADGRNARQLISAYDYTYNSLPAWSPDSRHILFASPDKAGQTDLYLMDVYSGSVRRLTFSPERDFFPVWQPGM